MINLFLLIILIGFMDHFLLFILMRIELMLSMPYWLLLSLASSSSKSYYNISLPDLLPILLLIHSTISLLLFTYHMPSQPIIIKSTLSFLILLKSGTHVIICYSWILLFFLYSKSPIALERFSPPLTLPKFTTPPAFVILSNSILSYGLWSTLSSWVEPLMQATARESPEFAHIIQSGVIRTTLAVHPAWDSS